MTQNLRDLISRFRNTSCQQEHFDITIEIANEIDNLYSDIKNKESEIQYQSDMLDRHIHMFETIKEQWVKRKKTILMN